MLQTRQHEVIGPRHLHNKAMSLIQGRNVTIFGQLTQTPATMGWGRTDIIHTCLCDVKPWIPSILAHQTSQPSPEHASRLTSSCMINPHY